MISERIFDDIPPQMKILNMVIPILMHFCILNLKLERCKPDKASGHPRKCDLINDVKLFQTVYRRIYCHKFLTSNKALCYKSKHIRIFIKPLKTNGLFHKV